MRSKKLTILDIAKLSSVGKSTVSRVLTNDPKKWNLKPVKGWKGSNSRIWVHAFKVTNSRCVVAVKKSSVSSFLVWILLLKTKQLALCWLSCIERITMSWSCDQLDEKANEHLQVLKRHQCRRHYCVWLYWLRYSCNRSLGTQSRFVITSGYRRDVD